MITIIVLIKDLIVSVFETIRAIIRFSIAIVSFLCSLFFSVFKIVGKREKKSKGKKSD